MTTYTNKHDAVMAMISRHMENNQDTISQLSIDTGIGRQQIHRWLNGSAKNIHNKSLHAVADALGYVINKSPSGIEVSHHNQDQGEPKMNMLAEAQAKTIQLQDEKIDRLELENKELQKSSINNPFKNQLWDQIMPNMSSTVYVKNVISYENMDRKIVDTVGAELFQKHLDLPDDIVKKCFSDTSWHKSKDHPIDTLVEKESLMDLKQISTYLVGLFNAMKWLTGITEYLDFPIKYRYKNKTLKTQCAVKIKLEKPIKIFTKSVILNEVN